MNGLVARALIAGTAFNIAVSLLMSFGSTALFQIVPASAFTLLSFALRIVSALSDIGGGAIGGYLARRDGALHGAATSILATLLLLPVSLLRMWWATRNGGLFNLGARYWIDFAAWTLVGIVLAAIAGYLAVELRKPKAS